MTQPKIPDNSTGTADVICPRCNTGWWVTNPHTFPWSGCPDCEATS